MKISKEHAERWKDQDIRFQPIGIIHSEHTEQENTPIQGIFNSCKGYVEIFPEYEPGLCDIESFTYLYLLYYFDRATGESLLEKPFLDGEKDRGIFAIRHFNRPNPIGLSIVRFCGVCKNILEVSGVDILDGTPLLDIKPYVKQFDSREDIKSGWVDDQHIDDITEWNNTPKELRKRK